MKKKQPKARVYCRNDYELGFDMRKMEGSWVRFNRADDGSILIDHANCDGDMILDRAAVQTLVAWLTTPRKGGRAAKGRP